jgi:hypothetical protein
VIFVGLRVDSDDQWGCRLKGVANKLRITGMGKGQIPLTTTKPSLPEVFWQNKSRRVTEVRPEIVLFTVLSTKHLSSVLQVVEFFDLHTDT